MNIRHKLKITLEEEELLVKELVSSFRAIYDQNAEHNFTEVMTKMLALDYDGMKVGDVIDIHYNQEFNLGALQMMINNIRSKRSTKPKPERR